jgi:hypothetical protein
VTLTSPLHAVDDIGLGSYYGQAVIDLEMLSKELPRRLTTTAAATARGPLDRKFALTIEAKQYIASVSVWENGCCDFDFLYLDTKKDVSWHYQFCCLEDAVRCIAHDINQLPQSARQAAGPVPLG